MPRLKQMTGAGLMLGLVLFAPPLIAGPLGDVEAVVFCGTEPFLQIDADGAGSKPFVARREVPALPGARFGVSARATSGTLTGAVLSVTRPAADGGTVSQNTPIAFSEDAPTVRVISLDAPEDLRPARWRMRATLGEVLLYDVTFDLITPCPSTSCR